MPAVMTLGGIAVAVLGLLIAFAGLPDRAAGLGLGSDLIQAGAIVFVGGLVVAALGQVLKSLQDVAERVDDAGFGLSGPRTALNDEHTQATPMPLPRAAARNGAGSQQEDIDQAPPARDPRASRAPQQPPRFARPAQEAQRAQPRPRTPTQPEEAPRQDEDFADNYSTGRQDAQPRWMRGQAEASNRQQAGTIPLQPARGERASPLAQPSPPRRDAALAPQPEADPRRRAVPQHEEIEHGEPTVVRSGIIAGMAYTLYSDRSIEAELPSGTVRFGSIEELQAHVKRAGVDEQEEYRGPSAAPH